MSICSVIFAPTHDSVKAKKIALISPSGQQITYEKLNECLKRICHLLLPTIPESIDASELSPTFITMFENSVAFVCTFLAIVNTGAPCFPLNPNCTTAELSFYIKDIPLPHALIVSSKSKSILDKAWECVERFDLDLWTVDENSLTVLRVRTRKKLQTSLEQKNTRGILRSTTVYPPTGNSVALVLYTSGTTSKPKCVPLTHSNILTSLRNISSTYSLTSVDTSLVCMPLFHVHGLIGSLLSTLFSGGTAVIIPKFSAHKFVSTLVQFQCTWYSAVPTLHAMLLSFLDSANQLHPSTHLRFIRSCSSSLSPSVMVKLQERFNVPVLEAYAMTEAAHQMTSNPLPPATRLPGSVGIAQGIQICLMDEVGAVVEHGEVCIRGENVTSGYIRRPEANLSSFINGWFRTGDQGYFNQDRYLILTGRIKELINRGGMKISPLEVDFALLEHPNVEEAVSFGAFDSIYGEVVHAAVVLKMAAHGKTEPTAVSVLDLQNHCRRLLASYKCPERIYLVSKLPKTATGKIQRRFVAAQFTSKI